MREWKCFTEILKDEYSSKWDQLDKDCVCVCVFELRTCGLAPGANAANMHTVIHQ